MNIIAEGEYQNTGFLKDNIEAFMRTLESSNKVK
jgi:hypothetical protein